MTPWSLTASTVTRTYQNQPVREQPPRWTSWQPPRPPPRPVHAGRIPTNPSSLIRRYPGNSRWTTPALGSRQLFPGALPASDLRFPLMQDELVIAIGTLCPEHIHRTVDFLLLFYQFALPRDLLVEIFHIAHVIRHDLIREMRETVYEQADAFVSEMIDLEIRPWTDRFCSRCGASFINARGQ